jgi:hypothetical protein
LSQSLGFNFKIHEKNPALSTKQYDEKTLKNVKKLDPRAIHRAEKIGSGAFSVVYKGTLQDKLVAIKDLNFANEREIEMWFREVEILGYVVCLFCLFVFYYYFYLFLFLF